VNDSDSFLAAYIGKFPQHVEPHGNALFSSCEYVRTKPEVFEEIKVTCDRSGTIPSKVYQEVNGKAETDLLRPRNKKQVRNPTNDTTYTLVNRNYFQ